MFHTIVEAVKLSLLSMRLVYDDEAIPFTPPFSTCGVCLYNILEYKNMNDSEL